MQVYEKYNRLIRLNINIFLYFCAKFGHMADDLQQLINSLSAKSQVLTERYAVVVDQRDRALETNRQLRTALRKSQTEVEQLRARLELLSISLNMNPGSPGDISATRTMLSDLLREIDKCISELNY